MTGKQSSFFRIDEQVIYTMISVCIISIIVFAFRYTTNKPCSDVSMSYGSDSIFVNEIVHFKTDANTGNNYSWNFGDGNELDKGTSSVNHKYKEARIYTVKLVVDDNCTDIRDLVVHERKRSENITLALPLVNTQQSAFTGDKVRFFDSSPASTSWEWYFEDSPEVFSRDREVWYEFKKAGSHKIFLMVNKNPALTFTDYITINNKPVVEDPLVAKPKIEKKVVPNIIIADVPTTQPLGSGKDSVKTITVPVIVPEVKKAPEFSKDQWSAALYDVSAGKKTAQEFAEYFCGNLDATVLYETNEYKFKDFCTELKKISDNRIKQITVITIKNSNNCVLSLQVGIKKTLLRKW